MKITDVEVIILKSPYAYGMAEGAEEARGPDYACVLRVHTDEGITGIADIDSNPQVMKAMVDAPTYVGILSQGLREIIVGEDPFEVERLWDKMYQQTLYHGRRGAAIQAMSGIDIALWDILGKAVNQPICKLLGACRRTKVRAYASTLFRDTPEEMAAAVRNYRAQGFTACKFGWGTFGQDLAWDVARVAAAREAAGDAFEIMIDGGHLWDVKRALRWVEALEPYRPYWIEEILHPDNVEGFGRLASATRVNIATGEQYGGRHEFRDLLARGRVDIIQPDISRAGGLTECRRIVHLAQDLGVQVVPHAWTSDILTAASLHLSAFLREALFLEYCVNATPLSRDLVRNRVPLRDGFVHLPEGPGLGVELNEETIERHRVA